MSNHISRARDLGEVLLDHGIFVYFRHVCKILVHRVKFYVRVVDFTAGSVCALVNQKCSKILKDEFYVKPFRLQIRKFVFSATRILIRMSGGSL